MKKGQKNLRATIARGKIQWKKGNIVDFVWLLLNGMKKKISPVFLFIFEKTEFWEMNVTKEKIVINAPKREKRPIPISKEIRKSTRRASMLKIYTIYVEI